MAGTETAPECRNSRANALVDADHALPVQQPKVIAEAIAGFVEAQSR